MELVLILSLKLLMKSSERCSLGTVATWDCLLFWVELGQKSRDLHQARNKLSRGCAIYTMSLVISLCLVNQAIEKKTIYNVQMCYFKYKYDCVVHFLSVVSCPRQQKIQKTYEFISVVNEARTV